MVLPAAQAEGQNIKKRYAVFNMDGSFAELKGFEIKRRGELKLIKYFQGQVFQAFLDGDTLESCYSAVAQISNKWLDILYNQGNDLEDDDVFDLISENKNYLSTQFIFCTISISLIGSYFMCYAMYLRHKKIQSSVKIRSNLFQTDIYYGLSITFLIPILYSI